MLVSALLGLAVGACGGAGDGSDGGLEPSLGQGNAASIRTEYLALGLPLASQDTGSIVASVLPHGAVVAGTTVSAAPVVADRVVRAGLGRIDWTQASGAAADKAAQDRAAQDKANQEKAAQARADAARYHVLAQQVVQAVNEARAQPRTCGDVALPAAPPLRWNAQVAYAALLESEWMLRTNKFSHGWDDGKYVWHRFEMVKYDWAQADENIAAGFRTLAEAMQAWIDSPSHCKASGRWGWRWCQALPRASTVRTGRWRWGPRAEAGERAGLRVGGPCQLVRCCSPSSTRLMKLLMTL